MADFTGENGGKKDDHNLCCYGTCPMVESWRHNWTLLFPPPIFAARTDYLRIPPSGENGGLMVIGELFWQTGVLVTQQRNDGIDRINLTEE